METIDRSKLFVESGASGIFVPGMTDENEIKEITNFINAPLNLLSLPGLTNCNKLKELGVKRFSFGNALLDKIIGFWENNAKKISGRKDTSVLYKD